MTFPAWDTLEEDARCKLQHRRVYVYLRKTLDFCEVRYAKRDVVAERTGVHQADVSRVLKSLVRWGYLIEHAPESDGTRRFTLAWSRGGGKTPPPATPIEAVAVR